MASVSAEFDGRAFVPSEKVELPVGTKVQVVIPGPRRPPTAEENQKWQEILQQLESSEPQFPSVEGAINYTRKRS